MSRTATQERSNTKSETPREAESKGDVAVFQKPRLAYHQLVQERFGVDKSGWKALIDAIWPNAQTADAVVLALTYCRARKLDPFKRPVHIVPVYSRVLKRMVEGIWPGVGELRTTAFRTGKYAGKDEAEWGPDEKIGLEGKQYVVPSWCRMTVYRIVDGQKCRFVGPKVYWKETYARAGRDTEEPNDMWAKRVRGQLEKCAEAAALRAAFPEELGDMPTAEEMEGQVIDGVGVPIPTDQERQTDDQEPKRTDDKSADTGAPPTDPFRLVNDQGDPLDVYGTVETFAAAVLEVAGDYKHPAALVSYYGHNMPEIERAIEVMQGEIGPMDPVLKAYDAAEVAVKRLAEQQETERRGDQERNQTKQARASDDDEPPPPEEAPGPQRNGKRKAEPEAPKEDGPRWTDAELAAARVAAPEENGIPNMMQWCYRALQDVEARIATGASRAELELWRAANVATLETARKSQRTAVTRIEAALRKGGA